MNDLKNIFKRQRPSLLRSTSADASRRNPLVSAITDVGSKFKTWWQETGPNSSDSDEEVPGPPPQKRCHKSLSNSVDSLANVSNVPLESHLADNEMEDEAKSRTISKNKEIPKENYSRQREYSEIADKCQRTACSSRTLDVPVPAKHDVTYSRSPAKRSVITRKSSVVFLNDVSLLEHETPIVAVANAGRPVQKAVTPSSGAADSLFESHIKLLDDESMISFFSLNEESRTLQTKPSLNLSPAIRFGGTSSTSVNPESLWHVPIPPDSDAELGSPSRHVGQAHRVPLRCAGSSKQSAAALVANAGRPVQKAVTPSSGAADSLFESHIKLLDDESMISFFSLNEESRTLQTKPSLNLSPAIRFGGTSSTSVNPESLWHVPIPPDSDAELGSPSRHVGQAHRVPLRCAGSSKQSAAALVANAGRPVQKAVTPSSGAADSLFESHIKLLDDESMISFFSLNEESRTLQTKPSLNLPPAIRFGGTSSTSVNPESLWHVPIPPDSDAELGSPSRHVGQAHRVPLRCAGSSKQSAAALVDKRGASSPLATVALLQQKQRSRIMETNKAARQLLSSQSSTRPISPSGKEEERPKKRKHPGKSSATNECKIPKPTSVKPSVCTKKQPVAEESMSGSRQKPKSGSRSKLRSTGRALVTSAGPTPSKSARPPKSTSATRLPSTSAHPPKSTSATRLPSTSARPPKSTSTTRLPSTSARPPKSTSTTRLPSTSARPPKSTSTTRLPSTSARPLKSTSTTRLPSTSARPPKSTSAARLPSTSVRPPKSTSARPSKSTSARPPKSTSARSSKSTSARPPKSTSARPSKSTSARPPKSTSATQLPPTSICRLSTQGMSYFYNFEWPRSSMQPATTAPVNLEPALVAPLAVENPDQNQWTCNDCWVSNKGVNKCVACGVSKPGSNKSVFNADAPPPLDDVFLAIVSEQKSKWHCSSCLTSNDSSKARCQCCDMEREGPSKELTPKPINFPKVSNTNFKFGMDPEQQKQSIAKKKIANETFIIINAEKIDDKENKYGKTSNYVKFHNGATNKTDHSLFLLPSAAPSCAASSSGAVPAPAASQAPGPAPVFDPAPEPCTTPAATPESTESPSSAPQFAFMSNPTTLTDNVPTTFENRIKTEPAVGFNLETGTTSTSGTSGLPAFPFGASSSVAPSTAAAETHPAPAPAFSATQPPPLITLAQNAPPAFSTSMFATAAFGLTTNKQLDSFSAQSQAFCGLPQTPNYNNIPIQNQGGFGSSVFGGNSTNQTSVFGATSQPLAFGSGAASCQQFGATSVNQIAAFGSSSVPQNATFTTFGDSDGQTTLGNNTSQTIVFSTGGGSQAAPFAAPFSLPTQQPAAPRPMFNFSGSTPVFGFGQFNFGARQTIDPPLGGVQFSVGSLPSGVASTRRIRKAVRRTQPR